MDDKLHKHINTNILGNSYVVNITVDKKSKAVSEGFYDIVKGSLIAVKITAVAVFYAFHIYPPEIM